ncbi:MAG: zinc ribbon domain-containing protein, partial [Myxococcota bacterium]
MITCPRCNHQNPDEASNCELCGADLKGPDLDATIALDVEELESVSIDLDESIRSAGAGDLDDLDLVDGDLFDLGGLTDTDSSPATATDPDLEHPSLRLPGITSSSSGQDPRRATGGLPSSRSGTNE